MLVAREVATHDARRLSRIAGLKRDDFVALEKAQALTRDLGRRDLSRYITRGGEHVAVSRREHHEVALAELDELAVGQSGKARSFQQQVVRNHMVRRVRHEHVRNGAGGRGQVRPLRAQLHQEEHGASQADNAKYVGKCVHRGLGAIDPNALIGRCGQHDFPQADAWRRYGSRLVRRAGILSCRAQFPHTASEPIPRCRICQ